MPTPSHPDNSHSSQPDNLHGETEDTQELPIVQEPLPPTADPDHAASPSGSSFAARDARQPQFPGLRLLKPGRRVPVTVALMMAVAALGTGAAIVHIGGGSGKKDVTAQPGSPGTPSTTAPPSQVASIPPAPVTTAAASALGTRSGSSSVQPHATQPPAFQGAFLISLGSKRCIASQGGSWNAGTQLVLADCDRNDPSQGWTLASDGTVRDFAGSLCMDVAGAPQNGTLLHLDRCSAAHRSTQTFGLKASYDLVEVQPDLCVDGKDKGTASGTVLQVWSCAGTPNQKWTMP